MTFSFLNPHLLHASAALALVAAGLWVWRRKPATALFVMGAACLCAAGAGPQFRAGGAPTHAAVLDVSGSVEARLAQAKPFLAAEQKRTGELFRVFQLSDTLRNEGDPTGGRTQYAALAALASDATVAGDIVLLTDGQGRLDQLLGAVDTSRLVLLRAPPALAPDAAITSLRGPSLLLPGATGSLIADLRCDRDAEVTWRVAGPDGEWARESVLLSANVPHRISHTFVAPASGVLRVRITVDCAGDRESRNNAATLAVAVGGRRVIHYARGREVGNEADSLAALLRSDARNELRMAHALPASAAELEGVHAVVANDLALTESGLTREGLRPLAQWVRNGGRLLMAGARGSFGPGGWRGSALEELMPVTFRPEDDKSRRYVLLLDCSDSMRASVGGQTRLELLRQAARRVLESLDERDSAAVVGFSQTTDTVEFLPLRERRMLLQRIDALTPRTTTHIHSALAAALRAMPAGATEQNRVLLITDGEDNEGADASAWLELAALAKDRAAVDVVLTENGAPPWLNQLRAGGGPGATANVGDGGFANILKALEQALRGSEESLLDDGSAHGGFLIPGIDAGLDLLCRTAPRPELKADEVMLEARTPPGEWKAARWPLVARREMAGRSVAVCMPAYGAIWSDRAFVRTVEEALGFLLADVERPDLQLNATDEGAELLWVGTGQAPEADLRLSNGLLARRRSTGSWLLPEYPTGDEVVVFAEERLIQRIPLAQFPARELAYTGDNEVFFAVAQQRGIRVVNSLGQWNPRRFGGQQERNLTWLAGLLAAACLLAGFGLRRR